MSLLSDLPDDILGLISIRLNGFDNCSLWMASDSILKQRLANNVITDFWIKYTIPGRYLWPGNFLKKLQNLSRLSLVVDKDVYHLPIQNPELFSIPTLKSLKLSFANQPTFQQTQLNSFNDPTGPTTSSSNLNDYYPNLEHLEIVSRLIEHVSIDFLGCLPQKLKTLSIPETFLKIGRKNNPTNRDRLNTNIGLLPGTLTKLHVNVDLPSSNEPCLDLSRLPPNLTSLITNACLDDETYHMIPKTLKKLKLMTCDLEKLTPFLPTGLEHLTLLIDEDPPTSQMLSRFVNLETLSVKSGKQTRLDDFIKNCPQKLKKLSCDQLDLTDLAVPSILFNNCLSKLELTDVVGISSQFISSLPQSLTDLTICPPYEYHQQPFAFLSLLPRKLKSLFTRLPIMENLSLLPGSLTYLRLGIAEPASYFDRLPPNLETFEAHINLPALIIKNLPASLTDLYLVSEGSIDDESIRMLPRGLKSLSLFCGEDNITDAGVAYLPPNLVKLSLFNHTNMTDNGIPLLPRSLMYLNLSQNPNFTDECIKHLPPKLTHVFGGTTKITSKSCKDLPKYLGFLNLRRCKDWDPEMLIASKNELPQYIKSISLGNSEAKKQWENIIANQQEKNGPC